MHKLPVWCGPERRSDHDGIVNDDDWAALAGAFVDDAYATAKGQVRTHVLHEQLLEHLPSPPARVLDVGGGAGNQSLPLARAGYSVTILDPSTAMLARARDRLAAEEPAVRARVTMIQATGEDAAAASSGQGFDAVCCHGVLMYQSHAEPLLKALCDRLAPGGVLSVMALNAHALAVRPALERRWAEALAAFDAGGELGVLGVATRADTVEDLSRRISGHGVAPVAWYGVWLFADWLDLDDAEEDEVRALAQVELRAARTDPYRQLSRVFHLVGRRT